MAETLLGRVCLESGGEEAASSLTVGESLGFWLDSEEDIVSSGGVDKYGILGFPRNWPESYSSCKALRRLVGKKGLAGVRTGVIDIVDDDEEVGTLKRGFTRGKSSFVVAGQAMKQKGWEVVKGFVVYEQHNAAEGTKFTAFKHWWNLKPDGTFVDLTQNCDVHGEMTGAKLRLLVETPKGDTSATLLTAAKMEEYNRIVEEFSAAQAEAKRIAEKRAGGDAVASSSSSSSANDEDLRNDIISNMMPKTETMAESGQAQQLLFPPEAESLIEGLRMFPIEGIGSSAWFRQRATLERLNLQAHHNVQAKSDEFIKSYLISHDKLSILVHELLAVEVWRDKVMPILDKACFEGRASNTSIYLALYHEAIVVNVLEVSMFHCEACESMSEVALLEVLDYCVRFIAYLNSAQCKTDAEFKERDVSALLKMTTADDFEERIGDLRLSIAFASLSILRYLTDYMNELPLGVMARLLDTHDVIVQLIPILEDKPWIRRRQHKNKLVTEVHEFGSWRELKKNERQRVTSAEAQLWLSLNNLIVDHKARAKYEYDDFRKNTVMRLKRFFNEVLFDQIPVLKDLQRVIDEIILMATPSSAEITQGRLIMEAVPEIRTALLKGGRWKAIAETQSRTVFSQSEEAENSHRERMKAMLDSFDFMALLEQGSGSQ